jgi:hypothetical protein
LLAESIKGDEEKLPVKVDLMPDVEEIENQYDTNSCTANAAATALAMVHTKFYSLDMTTQHKDF